MRIACIHQGYELYGSDRCFIETVGAIRDTVPEADLSVILPREGPIVPFLKGFATRVDYAPLWILRRKNLGRLATLGLLALPAAIVRALRRFATNDLVYINTAVVADHLLAARFFPGQAILHVHEIPQGLALRVLRGLIRWSRAEIVFNSQATRAAFALPESARARVIHNGIAGPSAALPQTYDGTLPLRVLMLGRLSRIKGQDVLLDALDALPPEKARRIELRIVGSAFEDPELERRLAARIAEGPYAARVTLLPFAPDPDPHYRWADIVTVPSRLPESLGRVAIEAMAYGRPPLVSAIGGLAEVVEDGRTGWCVPPDRADALAAALARIVATPEAWAAFPEAGRRRYEALFTEAVARRAIGALVRERCLDPRSHPHPHPEVRSEAEPQRRAPGIARLLEPSFEAAGAAPQDEGGGGRTGRETPTP
ncbi:glycosyltransferase [Methylobacterium sp. Leaf456]|uniref:glycosyltransferase n=1 Tax=Methylobacterium sp. Leaf456 TaxID=1736382 RepID=UPI0009E880AB|nr:glycosyltransferase [Methylobacterium sp. Leaf456]